MAAGPVFERATKRRVRIRLALSGPSGSGKTYTALLQATRIAAESGRRVAVIDTERGSASRYADVFDFDVLELQSFNPRWYIQAIEAAVATGDYAVLVIDSLSHAWEGEGGILDQVDKAQARSSGNKFAAWKDATPEQRAFVEALLRCPLHLIVTMRSKQEYVIETNERGRSVPRRVGMKPVQRDGIEYEFDVAGELDVDHVMSVTKTRCSAVEGAVIKRPGPEFAETLIAWAKGDGTEPKPLPPAPPPPPEPPRQTLTPRPATTAEMESDENARLGYPTQEQVNSGRTAAAPVQHEQPPADARSPREMAVDAFKEWVPKGNSAAAVAEKDAIKKLLAAAQGRWKRDPDTGEILTAPDGTPLEPDTSDLGNINAIANALYGMIGEAIRSREECAQALAAHAEASS